MRLHQLTLIVTTSLSALGLRCGPPLDHCAPCEAGAVSQAPGAAMEGPLSEHLDGVGEAFLARDLPAVPLDDTGDPSAAFLDFVAHNAGLSGAGTLRLERHEVGELSTIDVFPLDGLHQDLMLAQVRSGSRFRNGAELEAYSAALTGPDNPGKVGPSYVHVSASRPSGGAWFVRYISRIATPSFGGALAGGTSLFALARAHEGAGVDGMRYCSGSPCGVHGESLVCIDVSFAEPCGGCDAFTPLHDALERPRGPAQAPDWSCKDRNAKTMIF